MSDCDEWTIDWFQALSKALMDLRGEMVLQAQEDVKAHANQNTLELNVQKLVDKESKELKVRHNSYLFHKI